MLPSPTLVLAQATEVEPTPETPTTSQEATSPWLYCSGVLLILFVGLAFFHRFRLRKEMKGVRLEQYKNQDLQKRINLLSGQIKALESAPDLEHAREFSIDYLRRRMGEENFSYLTLNQIRYHVQQIIVRSIRAVSKSSIGGTGKKTSMLSIEETFDVAFDVQQYQAKRQSRILFRVKLILVKIPAQQGTTIVQEIYKCIEAFLSSKEPAPNWQPVVYGRPVSLRWDPQTRPTPLLVVRQSTQGFEMNYLK